MVHDYHKLQLKVRNKTNYLSMKVTIDKRTSKKQIERN